MRSVSSLAPAACLLSSGSSHPASVFCRPVSAVRLYGPAVQPSPFGLPALPVRPSPSGPPVFGPKRLPSDCTKIVIFGNFPLGESALKYFSYLCRAKSDFTKNKITMKLLEGKVAVITGAARGIGKAIALQFAKEGANIAFTDLVIDENGKATEAEIAALGVKAKGYASNAANFEETHKVIDGIVKEFGRIDILVNNAGITKDGLMMRMSEAQWDAVLTVNLKSAFNFIHAVVPVMARQRSGSIINMSSVVGVSGNAGQCNYSASKAGMIGLAKSIAKEMGPRGIRANCIAPGFIITDMTNQLSDEVKENWCKQIPLRRGGTPEDVAKVALFLASDLSSYVSGQVIHCCGAMNC